MFDYLLKVKVTTFRVLVLIFLSHSLALAENDKDWVYVGPGLFPDEFVSKKSIRMASEFLVSLPPHLIYAKKLVNYTRLSEVRKKYREGKALSQVYTHLYDCETEMFAQIGVVDYEQLYARGRVLKSSFEGEAFFIPARPLVENSYQFICN